VEGDIDSLTRALDFFSLFCYCSANFDSAAGKSGGGKSFLVIGNA